MHEQINQVIHELRGIKRALFVIAEFMLMQPAPDTGMTDEQKAALQAKANAIKAKLDAAATVIDDAAAGLGGVK